MTIEIPREILILYKEEKSIKLQREGEEEKTVKANGLSISFTFFSTKKRIFPEDTEQANFLDRLDNNIVMPKVQVNYNLLEEGDKIVATSEEVIPMYNCLQALQKILLADDVLEIRVTPDKIRLKRKVIRYKRLFIDCYILKTV